MSENNELEVKQVGSLSFEFDPQSSVNYIITDKGYFTIAVDAHEETVGIFADGFITTFTPAELRFMADCAEKLMKARSGK